MGSNPVVHKQTLYTVTCNECGENWEYDDVATLKELREAVISDGGLLLKKDGQWHFTCSECAISAAAVVRRRLAGTSAERAGKKLTDPELEALAKELRKG